MPYFQRLKTGQLNINVILSIVFNTRMKILLSWICWNMKKHWMQQLIVLHWFILYIYLKSFTCLRAINKELRKKKQVFVCLFLHRKVLQSAQDVLSVSMPLLGLVGFVFSQPSWAVEVKCAQVQYLIFNCQSQAHTLLLSASLYLTLEWNATD